MIELNEKQKNKIDSATLANYPQEMCGVLTKDDFIQIDNVSPNPESSFTMHRVQFGSVIDQAVAIVHSHVKHPEIQINIDLRTPSVKDKRYQKLSALPWLIVATEGQTVMPALQYPRTPNNNYLGRDFIWHINDCYTLVQDYYQFELGINLPDADIGFDPINGDINDVFANYVDDYGFKDIHAVDEIQDGDLVLIDAMGFTKNHLGIYHDESLLHQLQRSRLNSFKNYIGQINRILRYVG